ncbi:MAG: hypothetical protein ACFFBY_06450 [Promethearchaeota archaeon]
MVEIKSIIDDLGIAAFEANIKIAALAVMSNNGTLVYQTSNWDLINQTDVILNVMRGELSFILNDVKYSVIEVTTEGIIGTNDNGLGHVILVPFQGGLLVSYAMPQADPHNAMSFLRRYTMKLNGKL